MCHINRESRLDRASDAAMCTQITGGTCYSDSNSDSVALEWGQRRYTSNKLSGNTYDRRLIRFRDFFFSLFPFSRIFDQIQAQCFEEQVMVHSSIRRPPTSG